MTNALPPDPWKVLGLEKSADKAEIRTVYKKLVLKCHPDKVQDPKLKAEKQEEFQKVQQAYELLNDDAALAKYEAQVRLYELRKQHAAMKQNMANTSAPRSSPRSPSYAAYDIRTAEPRFRTSSSGVPQQTSSPSKMYSYSYSHSRSHEDMPSRRPIYEEDPPRSTRRTASYDYSAPKSSRKTEERRDKDDRRRRKEDDVRESRDPRERPRSRELSRERERDRVERKDKKTAREKEATKERDKERKPKQEDKTRRAKEAYVDEGEDEFAYAPKLDRKLSSGRKEEPPREKTSSRRHETASSPPKRESSFTKLSDPHLNAAYDYITRSRGPAAGPFRQPDPKAYPTTRGFPPAPTPPPLDEEIAAARGAARRASPDRVPKSPKEKTTTSSHKKPAREFEGVNIVNAASPPKDRVSPSFKRSSTMPSSPDPPLPPRRSQTASHEAAFRPSMDRAATFSADSSHIRRGLYEDHHEDVPPVADDRHRRRTRRTRSPEPHTRYKVDTSSLRTMKLDTSASRPYMHGTDPRSPLRAEVSDSSYAGTTPFGRVKESRPIDLRDISYSRIPHSYGDFPDQAYRMTSDPHSYGGYPHTREPYQAMA